MLELSQHSERSACHSRTCSDQSASSPCLSLIIRTWQAPHGPSASQIRRGTRLLTATASTSAARLGDFGPLSLVSLALASARTTLAWRGAAASDCGESFSKSAAAQPAGLGEPGVGNGNSSCSRQVLFGSLDFGGEDKRSKRERERECNKQSPESPIIYGGPIGRGALLAPQTLGKREREREREIEVGELPLPTTLTNERKR